MDFEKYFNPDEVKGRYQKAVASETAKALTEFCGQEQEFEQAVEQSGKTFQDCLDSITAGLGSSCSDLEIYKKAVKYYFPTADISFHMSINLCGDTGYEPPPTEVTHSSNLNVSLDSLLDF